MFRSVALVLVLVRPAGVQAFNADSRKFPGDRGSHRQLTELAVAFLRAAGRTNPKWARAHSFAARYRKEMEAGATGADNMNTPVDDRYREIELGLKARGGFRFPIKLPAWRPKILGKRVTVIPAQTFSISGRALWKAIEGKLQKGSLFRALMLQVLTGGTGWVPEAGGRVFCAFNHFNRRGKATGYSLAADETIAGTIRSAVRFVLLPLVKAASLGGLIKKVENRLGAWLDRNTDRTRIMRILMKALDAAARVRRLDYKWDASRPRAQRVIESGLGKTTFESASQMGSWWFKAAIDLFHGGKLMSNWRGAGFRGTKANVFQALGHALHFLQDACVPHHSMGILLAGHAEYEDTTMSRLIGAWVGNLGRNRQLRRRFHERVAVYVRKFLASRARWPGRLMIGEIWRETRRNWKGTRFTAGFFASDRKKPVNPRLEKLAFDDVCRAVAATAWGIVKFHELTDVKAFRAAPRGTR